MADTDTDLPALLPGWTEHTAPSGHTYYYHAETKQSTYKRPTVNAAPAASALTPPNAPNAPGVLNSIPVAIGQPNPTGPAPFLRLSDPRVANAFMQQQSNSTPSENSNESPRRPRHNPRRPLPQDTPVSKAAIPGGEPWVLVFTKFGRRFVYNPVKNQSFWRIPEKLKPAILEYDRACILKKTESFGPSEADASHQPGISVDNKVADPAPKQQDNDLGSDTGMDDWEYEEVEVTDDEDAGDKKNVSGGEYGDEEDDSGDEHARKRQKTSDEESDENNGDDGNGGEATFARGPVEFGEDDFAFQLQAAAAAEEYGFDDMYYNDEHLGGEEAYEEGENAGEDGAALFKALLNDYQINPYSSWDKLLEEGKLFDDPRYTALHTMKARRAVWEEWSKAKIKVAKEQKSKEEKDDPLVMYLSLLQKHATPRLYWAEFKRKFRKEDALRNAHLSEKDKEKWYRDYVGRLKLPPSTLKSDFTKFLTSIPSSDIVDGALPKYATIDLRYIGLDAKVRDPLVEAYLQSKET